MIIGLSGAACSGKTTLAREIARRYGFALVEEIARKVFAEKYTEFGSLEELRRSGFYLDYQLDVLREQVRAEDRAMQKNRDVVVDRTVYDNLMYTLLWCSSEDLSEYFKEFRRYEQARRYDVIFLCHPLPPENDGFRTALHMQPIEHSLLMDVLPAYIELPATSLEERIGAIASSIQHFRRKEPPEKGRVVDQRLPP